MSVDKDTKYDRQLRLWASTGQANLESSHICLINATATGSEILKNLVLPGIGKFSIIDECIVSQNDFSSNFFLRRDNLGQSRAVAIAANLAELNNDVIGNGISESVNTILTKYDDTYWDQFNAVIVSDYIEELHQLMEILWSKQIPLLLVNTIGFYGSLNLIANEVTVIETHDPSKLYDLRIDCPWDQLQTFVDSINLDTLDDTEHAHVPYIVIYIKALNLWKLDHEGLPPQNYNEKKQFRLLIETLARYPSEGNFIEASNSIHRALQITHIPHSVSILFENNYIKDENINLSTPIFWIYIKALKNFVAKNNQLPLPGNLPDMASDTSNYINLQRIYREKATKDQSLFTEEVDKILDSVGRSTSDMTPESISSFCKNSQLLYVTQGSKNLFSENLVLDLLQYDDTEFNTLGIYFAILTYNNYIKKYSTGPSIKDYSQFEALFLSEFGISKSNLTPAIVKTIQELLSHNTHGYHNLNSLMGGIVSQEVLKLVTSQYTPLDNLFVFDGVRSVSDKWKIQ